MIIRPLAIRPLVLILAQMSLYVTEHILVDAFAFFNDDSGAIY